VGGLWRRFGPPLPSAPVRRHCCPPQDALGAGFFFLFSVLSETCACPRLLPLRRFLFYRPLFSLLLVIGPFVRHPSFLFLPDPPSPPHPPLVGKARGTGSSEPGNASEHVIVTRAGSPHLPPVVLIAASSPRSLPPEKVPSPPTPTPSS